MYHINCTSNSAHLITQNNKRSICCLCNVYNFRPQSIILYFIHPSTFQAMAGKDAENAEKTVLAELEHENSKMREQNNKLVEELMEQKNVGLFVIYIKR